MKNTFLINNNHTLNVYKNKLAVNTLNAAV